MSSKQLSCPLNSFQAKVFKSVSQTNLDKTAHYYCSIQFKYISHFSFKICLCILEEKCGILNSALFKSSPVIYASVSTFRCSTFLISILENLTKLRKLFLVSNKITKIENVSHLKNLDMLELGDNRIRQIENLDGLTNLKELFLGKNKITKLANLDKLPQLELISLQANRLIKIEGLEALVNLEQLYIADNGIEKIENLSENKALTTLELANNKISTLDGLNALEKLEEFWFNDNQVCINFNFYSFNFEGN